MKAQKIFDIIKQHHPTMGGTEIIDLMNEGTDNFCRRSELFKQSFSQASTAGTRYYTLDDKVFKILSVTIDEVAIPRLSGGVNIDDDELTGDPNNTYDLGAPSTISNERYWYEDLGRIAIVEKKTNAISRDDVSSNYQSISETGLTIRLKTISAPEPLTVSDVTAGNVKALAGVPGSFSRYIGDYCIAEGYRKPASMNPQQADYFEGRFEKAVKDARKFARTSYVSSGRITPVDF